RLGVDFTTLAESYRSFAASARGTTLEGQQARDVFVAITEASATLGLSSEATGRALTALSQIMSKGKVSAEELRGQLGEALPGAFQIAARAVGVTTQELDRMLQQGELLASDFLPKFGAQVKRELGDATGEAAKRAGAGMAVLGNAFKEAAASIAQSGLSKAVDDASRSLASLINHVFQTQTAVAEMRERLRKETERSIEDINRLSDAQIQAIDRAQHAYETAADARIRKQREVDKAIAQSRAEDLGLAGVPGGRAEVPTMGVFGAEEQAARKRTEALQKQLTGIERFKTLGPATEQVTAKLREATKVYDELTEKLIETPTLAQSPAFMAQVRASAARVTSYQAEKKALDEKAAADKQAEQQDRRAAEAAVQRYEAGQKVIEGLQGELVARTQGWEAAMRHRLAVQELSQAQIEQAVGLERQKRQWDDLEQAISKTTGAIKDVKIESRDTVRDPTVGSATEEEAGGAVRRLRWKGFTEGLPETFSPMDQAMDALAQSTSRWDKSLKEAERTLRTTMPEAVRTFADLTEDKFGAIAEVSRTLADGVLDSITSITRQGSFSFSQFADSVIQDLLRILQQKFLAPQLEKWIELGIGAATSILGGLGGGGGLSASTIAAGGGNPGLAVGGPLRRGLTLVGEAGPEAIATRGGRSVVFPTSHPVTRAALKSANMPRRQYGGPLPSAVMGGTGSQTEGMQTRGTGVQDQQPVINVYVQGVQDAASFVRSRGEIQRQMQAAFRASQRS
ncbi:MAG TPA: tape measure protein, partial [Dongiaceae bacterium]